MIITRVQQLKVMRFCSDMTVADTADFPVIRNASDTKDTEYHPKLVGDHFMLQAVWKGHIKSD